MNMTFKEVSHVLELIREECMKRPDLVKEEHRSELQHAIVQACEQVDMSPKDHLVMDKLQEERPDMLTGHCYVASEAFYHLVGGSPKQMNHEGTSHWWIELSVPKTGELSRENICRTITVDPTVEQFETEPPYDEGTGRGFLTSEPSQRAQEIIQAVEERL